MPHCPQVFYKSYPLRSSNLQEPVPHGCKKPTTASLPILDTKAASLAHDFDPLKSQQKVWDIQPNYDKTGILLEIGQIEDTLLRNGTKIMIWPSFSALKLLCFFF